MAFGLMRALYENGRHVPDDVSVVGFDGIDLAEYSSPPLTTVRQDFDQIGKELLGLLLDQIRGEASSSRQRIIDHGTHHPRDNRRAAHPLGAGVRPLARV